MLALLDVFFDRFPTGHVRPKVQIIERMKFWGFDRFISYGKTQLAQEFCILLSISNWDPYVRKLEHGKQKTFPRNGRGALRVLMPIFGNGRRRFLLVKFFEKNTVDANDCSGRIRSSDFRMSNCKQRRRSPEVQASKPSRHR
uniref:Uncharacterized protein n=1 Tax=Haptolina brevifila TaxID=156173 RepID=A0A7S2E3Y2_9EUKA